MALTKNATTGSPRRSWRRAADAFRRAIQAATAAEESAVVPLARRDVGGRAAHRRSARGSSGPTVKPLLYDNGGAWFAANEGDGAVIAEAMAIVAAAKAP